MENTERLRILGLQYALLSLVEECNQPDVIEVVESIAFLPKHFKKVESVLTPGQREIYLECFHIDEF